MLTLLLQLLAVVLFLGLITIAVLAFIEPGPLERRSRDRRGNRPPPVAPAPSDEEEQREG
ncbi:MAG: hypothetical protein NZ528_13715 [Caldilineales bacterium]|nr:hypothetical protein [Caldilineales bacterium]MDW8319490.1 hypothetical protein [Anaerolineae bacterium]